MCCGCYFLQEPILGSGAESRHDVVGDQNLEAVGIGGDHVGHGGQGDGALIGDDVLLPGEPTPEEKEMDNMFDEMNYPTVTEIYDAKESEVGMRFKTREEAYHFFKLYARKTGFAVKKDTAYTSRPTGVLYKQVFVCNKSRKSVVNDDPGRKRRSNIIPQTECKVLVRLKLESNEWKIIAVHLEHNHDLAPSIWLVRFMRCHKYMSPGEKRFITILQNSRVPPRKVMSIFRLLRGHLRAVGFDAKDITNLKSAENKTHVNKDIDELVALFKERQRNIPGFYYALQTDGDGTVRSVFWTDAVGRSTYKIYGDYVSFNTTFSTNVYDMPFAPIVGQ
jgi:hypothetical protein